MGGFACRSGGETASDAGSLDLKRMFPFSNNNNNNNNNNSDTERVVLFLRK